MRDRHVDSDTQTAVPAFWRGWILAVGATGLVLVLSTLPPFVPEPLRFFIMHAFSPFCHQMAERSFHVDGVALAVCHRCTGVYSGLLLGSAGFLFVRRWDGVLMRFSGFILLAAILIPGGDWLAGVFGIWQNTAWSRVGTGVVFGVTAGYFLARALASLGKGGVEAASPRQAANAG